MRNALRVTAFGLCLALLGCGPHWVVVRQAVPDPVNASTRFTLAATLDPNFRVGEKTEQEWMAEKKESTRDSWAGDKAAMADNFVDGFMAEKGALLTDAAPGAGAIAVRARYTHYDPGFYAAVVSSPTTLDATIELADAQGNVMDEIRVSAKYSGFSAGEGARACSKQIGIIAAKYVKTRAGL